MWGLLLMFLSAPGNSENIGVFQIQASGQADRARISAQFEALANTQAGSSLLQQLQARPHQIQIIHDASSATIEQSGNTTAIVSRNMRNGVGVGSELRLNFRTPAHGSHCVPGMNGDWIEFPLIINLHHELTHAWHFSSGTYRAGYSEYQAIESENILRAELGLELRNPNFPAGIHRPANGCHGPVPEEFLRN